MEPLDPFKDVFADLSLKKTRIVHEGNASQYSPYLMNKAFSYFLDTIFHANELNMNPQMDNLYQYEYYFNAIKKRKRFSGWKKRIVTAEQAAVSAYYDYSLDKASEVLPLLKDEELKVIMKYAESQKQINSP